VKKPAETKYALGQARGGVVWWENGQEYVELLRTDGPVLLISLHSGREGPFRYPELARDLFVAFTANVLGISIGDAAQRTSERKIDPFWDDLASVLVQTRIRKK
jgi:hypothetical protein